MESFPVLMSSYEDKDNDDDDDKDEDNNDNIEASLKEGNIQLRMKAKKMMNPTSCQPMWILHLIVL